MDFRPEPPSDIVFIGNVAYETTEEQLKKMLELAGPVVDIQLVFDPITNRAKGFGFCQYADRDIAASAIKNLNDTLVDGRNIKIGYADRGRVRRYLGTDGTTLSGGNGGTLLTRTAVIETNAPAIPQLRSIAPAQVAALVGSLDSRQKRDLLGQFQSFAAVNMVKAREELSKNPALAHALLGALESLGMADEAAVARIRGSRGGYRPPPMSDLPPPNLHSPSSAYSPSNNSHSPLNARPPPPPQHVIQAAIHPEQQHYHQQQHQHHMQHEQHQHHQQPDPSRPDPPQHAPDPMAEMDNTEVLNQLLSLTDEQLAQLPEDHRSQILDLRRQLREG
ncbi:hypothetical protein H4R18_005865 [Coemansia javaensis]|uniref:RRM domain-containing protein n=1 Tax=Coemansia javaensis TaxID=2761396 RepID=A0A9W8H1X0_9FUNG|nr:hypothetical protein H4R18_005865 [Coemansia javaensis]